MADYLPAIKTTLDALEYDRQNPSEGLTSADHQERDIAEKVLKRLEAQYEQWSSVSNTGR